MLTTETLEGVATPVTELLSEELDDELPPPQPASNKVSAAKQMLNFAVVVNLCWMFMMGLLVSDGHWEIRPQPGAGLLGEKLASELANYSE